MECNFADAATRNRGGIDCHRPPVRKTGAPLAYVPGTTIRSPAPLSYFSATQVDRVPADRPPEPFVWRHWAHSHGKAALRSARG